MTVIIKKLDNSFLQIKNFDQHLSKKLSSQFAFKADNYQFTPQYKAGLWDGFIRLFNIQTGKLPIGFAKEAYKIVRNYTTDIVCDLNLFDKGLTVTEKEIHDFCDLIKLPFKPYDHQTEAVIKCLKEKRLTCESATNSGKSLNMFLIANFLLMNNKNEKILIIVPSVQLVEQLTKDFCDYAKDWVDYNTYVHKIYSGQDKTSNKQITISTYQSMMNLPKSAFECFTTLIVDECHIIFNNTESVKCVTKIINNCVNAENKFGFSGSLTTKNSNIKQLTGLFGKLERIINAKQTIELGISSAFDIRSIILDYKKDRRIDLKNQVDSIKKKKKVETAKYSTEMKFTRELDEKVDFLVKFCSKIEKNTIVLFKSIEYGNRLYRELYKKSGKRVYYIDGSIKVEKREEIRENMEKYNDCLLVGSLGTCSTGLNVRNIHNAVLVESVKSEIKIVQTIGRILRKHNDKKAIFYDIADDLSLTRWSNYSMKHYRDRLKIYRQQEHKIKVVRLKI